MDLRDYYPLILVVAVIVGAIFSLRIFFTLWEPIDRRLNGDRAAVIKVFPIAQLKDQVVNIHLKSRTRIDGVTLIGYSSGHQNAPFYLRQLLVTRYADGRTVYIRIDEIEYIEQVAATA